jgi:hypothetical protein
MGLHDRLQTRRAATASRDGRAINRRRPIAICGDLDFTGVKTHIASGNVAFTSRESATAAVRDGNPVPDAFGKFTVAMSRFRRSQETCSAPRRSRKPLPLVSGDEFLFVPSGESAVIPMTWFAARSGFPGCRGGRIGGHWRTLRSEMLDFLLKSHPTA